MSDLDRYGGCREIRFEPTGYFRLERTDRWWMVTPEGHGFLSWGINHVDTRSVTAPYNADHWAQRFGVPAGPRKALLADAAFMGGLVDKIETDMGYLGANTLGCHSPQDVYPQSLMPYVLTLRFVDTCHYMVPGPHEFHDVFSPQFERHCDRVAREQAAPRAEDPFLLGYFYTDGPIWTDLDAAPHGNNIYGQVRPGLPTWPRVLRNLGPDAPGKRAYVQAMRELYADDVAVFNATYGAQFPSFDDLRAAQDWRLNTDPSNQRESRDNMAFLKQVVDRCYQVENAAIRRYDPNHMIFGDKLNANTMDARAAVLGLGAERTEDLDDLIRVVGRHMDLVFLQYYALWPEHETFIDRCSRLTNKPVFQGDASISLPNERMPDPFGPHVASQGERTAAFQELVLNAYARPDFVGWNWCGWIDRWEAEQPNKQHSGVQDPFGRWHPIAHAMRAFSAEMYAVARGLNSRAI